jgi:hypothetical protein
MKRRRRSKTGLLPYSEREIAMMRTAVHPTYADFSLNRYASLETWLRSDEYRSWLTTESQKVQLMEGDWRQP